MAPRVNDDDLRSMAAEAAAHEARGGTLTTWDRMKLDLRDCRMELEGLKWQIAERLKHATYYEFGEEYAFESADDWESYTQPDTGTIAEVTRFVPVGKVYFACVATELDADGDPIEHDAREYPTELAALEALEASGRISVEQVARIAQIHGGDK
jgi:hypothetical protein